MNGHELDERHEQDEQAHVYKTDDVLTNTVAVQLLFVLFVQFVVVRVPCVP